MTEIQNPKQKNNRFEPVWNLRPARSCPRPPRLAWLAGELAMAGGLICNLVLGICDFRHKTPRQSHLSLTWPKGPGFQCKKK